MLKKKGYLCSASALVAAAAWSSAANAQNSAPAPDAPSANQTAPTSDPVAANQAASTAAPETSGAADIIVTATKRAETLQDVPIQISVLTDKTLTERGITQASQFLSTTPNVTFIEDNAGEAYINIRGQTAVRASDPNVAIVIDGVTLSSTKPFNRNIFGVQQIEVVKGPQTALYGRNAAAGAVVITTKKPGDELEGDVTGSVGRYDTIRAAAGISGPLTDTLGFSIAGATYHTNGPFKSVTTGANVYRTNNDSVRGRLYYEDGKLTADLKVDYFVNNGAGISYNGQIVGVPIPPYDGKKLDVSVIAPFVSNVTGINSNRFIGATLKLDYDLGLATLTSITGFNKFREYFGGDGIPYLPDTGQPGATTTEYLVNDTNISQELRLTSNGKSRFRWQVGGYFLNFKRDGGSRVNVDTLGTLPGNPRAINGPGTPQPTTAYGHPVYNTRDYAVFANAQYDILDSLTLSLAGRYDIEKRSVKEVAPIAFNTCVILNNIPIDQCHSDKTFKVFSPKATLSFHPTNQMNFYASYGKGFKSGGFNPIGSRQATINATPPALQPFVYVQDIYSPEKAESYEIGTKLDFFNGKLRFNGSAFKTSVTGAQQFAFFPSTGLQTVVSIDKVKLKGFDLGLDYTSPIDTGVSLGFGYVDGKVAKFAGNAADVGNVAPGSAKYTLFVGVQQPIDIGPDYKLVPRVEFNRYGRIWWDVDNTPGTRRAPLNITNARITLRSIHRWQVGAWMDNVFNKKYYQEIVPLLPVISVQYRGWTRSFGLDAKYNF